MPAYDVHIFKITGPTAQDSERVGYGPIALVTCKDGAYEQVKKMCTRELVKNPSHYVELTRVDLRNNNPDAKPYFRKKDGYFGVDVSVYEYRNYDLRE